MKKNKFNKLLANIILYLFPILSYYGYQFVGLNQTLMKGFYFLSIPVLALYIGKTWKIKSRSPYLNKMRMLILMLAVSILMSWLIWGQPILLGYLATAPVLAYIFFFFLVKGEFSQEELERYIWINAFIWIFLWIIAYAVAPVRLFGYIDNELNDSRGVFRISIPGYGAVILAYFLAINKLIITKKKIFVFLTLLLFVFITFRTVRQVILFSFLIGLYYLIHKIKYSWVYIIIAFCILNFGTMKIERNSLLGNLIELTENQLESHNQGDTYIRVLEYKYFFTDYNNNPIAILLGNGTPHHNHKYGKREQVIQESFGYFQSDVGYARIYVTIGIVGLYIVLCLFFFPLQQNVQPTLMFAKLYIIYQIFANIAASWIWGEIIFICISFYLLHKSWMNEKYKTS